MNLKRRFVVVASAGVVALAAITYFGWLRAPHEFRGTLLYDPDVRRIPEDPPVLALLITATGTYELDAPDRNDRKKWHPVLTNLNGRQVIVRGTLRVRHAAYRPSRAHPTILVEELMPAVPNPADGSSAARPSQGGRMSRRRRRRV